MSLKTIRSVALATLGAVVLAVVGCAPAPSAAPAGGSPSTLPTNGPPLDRSDRSCQARGRRG
jgi:hypothetical protein